VSRGFRFDAALCRDVLAVFIRVVLGWSRRRAASRGIRDSQCGAVTGEPPVGLSTVGAQLIGS